MSGFRPVVPNLTDPDLMGVEEPKAVATTKSNVVSNLTIVVSSVVLTIIVILLVWQGYKLFTDSGDTHQEAMLAARQYKRMEPPPRRRQEVRREAQARGLPEPRGLRELPEDSQDDAAMGHMVRPILKSGGRITDVFEEVHKEDMGRAELEEIVVEEPGNIALPDETVSLDDLLKEMSEDSKSVSFLEPEQSCNFVPKSGKNKGKACGGTVVSNAKCKAHNKAS